MLTPLQKAHPIGAEHDRELLRDAISYVYKKTSDGELLIHLFLPKGHQEGDRRAATIFFHGGLWDKPIVTQFVPQCMHFASRGAIGVTAEYRVSGKHGTSPMDAIRDAQTAILWLRINHDFLGIDPDQVIAGGAGSGAHLALCAALHKNVERDGFYSSHPDALILYSALVNTSPKGVGSDNFLTKKDAKIANPMRYIRRKMPPAIFFHGKADPITPFAQVEAFVKKYKRKRNYAVLTPYDRATHSFFNFNVNQHHYVHTIESADGFLCELGFLQHAEGFIDPF